MNTQLPDISNLSTEQLRELNHRIVRILRNEVAQAARMYYQGDRVSFNDKFGRLIAGTVTKVNNKTICVKADDGMSWKCTATLLKRI